MVVLVSCGTITSINSKRKIKTSISESELKSNKKADSRAKKSKHTLLDQDNTLVEHKILEHQTSNTFVQSDGFPPKDTSFLYFSHISSPSLRNYIWCD
jgi:hypothetical protein